MDSKSEMELIYLSGDSLLYIHPREKCSGFCAFHNPVPGAYQSLPIVWRADRYMVERLCPHGVGHPDPNQFRHWMAHSVDNVTQVIHGCCWEFCCTGWYELDNDPPS